MHDILVNSLSVTNQSGRHVLAGHLDQLAPEFRVAVIARESMEGLREVFKDRVDWFYAPERTSQWLFRAAWECLNLQTIAHETGARFYFTPSGIAAPRISIPQVVLCQNPWAMVPSARKKKDALKAWLQRRAYRKTMRRAEVMAFNSLYMQKAYRENAGFKERRGAIVYQAAAEETRLRAEALKGSPRNPGQIVCASVMGRHKNIETLVKAFSLLPDPASLQLVGSWPDHTYEREIRQLVDAHLLRQRVFFRGFLPREELDQVYAESQVFCLVSRCESFGIPAIEAQLFGTPVVCSTACAVPEICGAGGLFCDPDGIESISNTIKTLLEDSTLWRRLSERARKNADRFRWEYCSKPLAALFKELG